MPETCQIRVDPKADPGVTMGCPHRGGSEGLGVEILRNRNPLRRPPQFSSTHLLENADSSTSAAMRYVYSLTI
jgi:hypothetical protein